MEAGISIGSGIVAGDQHGGRGGEVGEDKDHKVGGGEFEADSRMGTGTTALPDSGMAVALVHNRGMLYVLHLLRTLPRGAIASSSTSLSTGSRRAGAGAARLRGAGIHWP
jgi:hypothetical protein